MPKPRAGELQDDFLDRCIPQVIEEGRSPDQAVAMCISYYEGYQDKAYNLDKGGRYEYWKAFDRLRETYQSKFERRIRKAFREQLSIYDDASTIADLRKDIREEPMQEAFLDLYTEVGDRFARNTYQGLKNQPYPETKQEPTWIERMKKYVTVDALERIRGINETTRRRLVLALQIGLENGEGIDDIKRRIMSIDGTLAGRARTIARTEIISASNAGSLAGADSTGLNYVKEWVSTFDGKARKDHENWDEEKANKGQPFRLLTLEGETVELDFPGDPKGPAGQVINCRCTQVYITEE